MSMIQDAARPLAPRQRGPFVAAVAAELQGREVGAGNLFKILADLQHRFLAGHGPARGRYR
jgi:hypothetical protein